MRILAVCGYKRHGKDSFVADLLAASRRNAPRYGWSVFARRGGRPLSVSPDACRLSFADRLKAQVHRSLGLPDNYEPDDKEAPVLPGGASFRDLYKRRAAEVCATNPHFWAEAAISSASGVTQALISDFRFPAETETMLAADPDLLTARVFCANAPLPDPADHTEHSLDSLTTDYLALPLVDLQLHLDAALRAFPQYRCFAFHMNVC